MIKTNYEDYLWSIKAMLQDKVADYLDVNREHIKIVLLGTDICGEDCIDWDADEDDAAEGIENETYYMFSYAYRKDKRTIDYEEPVDMVWRHIEGDDRIFDEVMTEQEFEKLFEDKKHNICSMLWYEGNKNISAPIAITPSSVRS